MQCQSIGITEMGSLNKSFIGCISGNALFCEQCDSNFNLINGVCAPSSCDDLTNCNVCPTGCSLCDYESKTCIDC